jgi:hypothetical protein
MNKYVRFGAMIATSTVVMFGLMYLNTYQGVAERQSAGPAANDRARGMKARAANLWERLRSSFWFVPVLMVGGAIVLSFATLLLDEAIQYTTIERSSP